MSTKLFDLLEQLIEYGLENNMMHLLDTFVVRNALWRKLGVECDLDVLKKTRVTDPRRADVLTSPIEADSMRIYHLLNDITSEAKAQGEKLDFLYEEEMFQAELMALLMPRNSEINAIFWSLHKANPVMATEYFYALSNASTYIRMDRVSKNISWKSASKFGDLDITINLSKPEKNPKEIELQKHAKPSVYPKCLLCVENAGYSGNINHPARHNHRLVELDLANEPWYFQYSPYVYYNEHAIVLCHEHRNMKIDRKTFIRLCDFVDYMPHYFIGSNADLHTVGGSILTHDHYQAGNYEMPMMRAKTRYRYEPTFAQDVKIDVIEWPLSVLKLVSTNKAAIINASSKILDKWIGYSDETVDLIAHTFERHNTVTPILRKNDDTYEMYLALRNNRRTVAHPEGLFHPHAEHHHIKRENIGLIEVMGLAVLPARLVTEIDGLIDALVEMKRLSGIAPLSKIDENVLSTSEELVKHVPWTMSIEDRLLAIINDKNNDFSGSDSHEFDATKASLLACFRAQIGLKFGSVLEDAGIYKEDYDGMRRFLEACEEVDYEDRN